MLHEHLGSVHVQRREHRLVTSALHPGDISRDVLLEQCVIAAFSRALPGDLPLHTPHHARHGIRKGLEL